MGGNMTSSPESSLDKNINLYHLKTTEVIGQFVTQNIGSAYVVDKNNFHVLQGVACYTIEVYEECMRLPHWHPNASELGYVISGNIEVITWRSPGESAVFTLGTGMCWFIPKAALHSLNNVGNEKAKLLVGFSNEDPQDIDLPVAFNGIPAPLRDAYTSPHKELREWNGPMENPLFGRYSSQDAIKKVLTASPYGFDLNKVTPLFKDQKLGSVIWGIKSNWSILEEISVLRAILNPGVARDAIWYPDVGTLYVVAKGKGQFNIIIAKQKPILIDVKLYDYIFVPMGVLHTFANHSSEIFEVIAFFTKAYPQPEVSLSVATAFFPNRVRRDAMTKYGNNQILGDPLKSLQYIANSPYLIRVGSS
jgi:oxalate decarboxylase